MAERKSVDPVSTFLKASAHAQDARAGRLRISGLALDVLRGLARGDAAGRGSSVLAQVRKELGLTPAQLTRALAELRSEGLITLSGDTEESAELTEPARRALAHE